jgi:hypothetical protein
MDYKCIASKLIDMLSKGGYTHEQLNVIMQAISDLRAAYCSFCNKALCRDKKGIILDATVCDKDTFRNKIYKCNLCINNVIA